MTDPAEPPDDPPTCAQCGNLMPRSPSEYFCGPTCAALWAAARNERREGPPCLGGGQPPREVA